MKSLLSAPSTTGEVLGMWSLWRKQLLKEKEEEGEGGRSELMHFQHLHPTPFLRISLPN